MSLSSSSAAAATGGGGGMKPVYKLRGHSGSILCSTTSRSSPNEVVSSSEDGTVRIFDLRSRTCSMRLQAFGGEPVTSVSLNHGNAAELYVAAAAAVYCVELRLGSSGRELQRYDVNLDEINQVVVNQKGTYIAAADDGGEIKVIDVHNHKLYRTLRGVHTNICSALQFHGQKPWEVISGGLDSKIVKWDFWKGRALRSLDLGNTDHVGQLCNPPFVHALAIPEGDGSGEIGRFVAVARGDGAVEVYDPSFKNGKSPWSKGLTNKKGRHRNNSSQDPSCQGDVDGAASGSSGVKCHLDRQHGGHLAAVSSVTFANFGERGQYILSGGNDKLIKLWNWRSSTDERQSEDRRALVLDIQHGKKVNWLSTINRSSGNLLVADTSKVLSVYHIL